MGQPVKRLGIVALIGAVLVLAGCGGNEGGTTPTGTGGSVVNEALKLGEVGSRAAGFSLDDINGKELSLRVEGDEQPVTLLVFWATWCTDCRADISATEKFHRETVGKGVRVIAVSQDEGGKKVPAFVTKTGITYPVAMDRDGAVGRSYGLQGIPYVVVVDGQGIIRYTGHGVVGAVARIEEMISGEADEAPEEKKEDTDGTVEG